MNLSAMTLAVAEVQPVMVNAALAPHLKELSRLSAFGNVSNEGERITELRSQKAALEALIKQHHDESM